jgi:hypothetical protein
MRYRQKYLKLVRTRCLNNRVEQVTYPRYWLIHNLVTSDDTPLSPSTAKSHTCPAAMIKIHGPVYWGLCSPMNPDLNADIVGSAAQSLIVLPLWFLLFTFCMFSSSRILPNLLTTRPKLVPNKLQTYLSGSDFTQTPNYNQIAPTLPPFLKRGRFAAWIEERGGRGVGGEGMFETAMN